MIPRSLKGLEKDDVDDGLVPHVKQFHDLGYVVEGGALVDRSVRTYCGS